MFSNHEVYHVSLDMLFSWSTMHWCVYSCRGLQQDAWEYYSRRARRIVVL